MSAFATVHIGNQLLAAFSQNLYDSALVFIGAEKRVQSSVLLA